MTKFNCLGCGDEMTNPDFATCSKECGAQANTRAAYDAAWNADAAARWDAYKSQRPSGWKPSWAPKC